MKAFPCEWAKYDTEAEENLVIDCGVSQKVIKSKGKWVKHNDPGMDLRDYFAAKAMNAFLLRCDDVKDNYDEKGIAIMSYAMADAMMEERK